jgi:hypothetical protein
MMTTKEPNSDLLVSRAMAVAAQVSHDNILKHYRALHQFISPSFLISSPPPLLLRCHNTYYDLP